MCACTRGHTNTLREQPRSTMFDLRSTVSTGPLCLSVGAHVHYLLSCQVTSPEARYQRARPSAPRCGIHTYIFNILCLLSFTRYAHHFRSILFTSDAYFNAFLHLFRSLLVTCRDTFEKSRIFVFILHLHHIFEYGQPSMKYLPQGKGHCGDLLAWLPQKNDNLPSKE